MGTQLDEDSSEISRQMADVRARLDHRAALLADSTTRMMDWRGYLRRYPGVTASIAIAIGFWLSPSRRNKSNQLTASVSPTFARSTSHEEYPVPNKSATLAGGLFQFAKPFISQAMTSVVKDHFSQILRSAMVNTSANAGSPIERIRDHHASG